MPRAQIGAIDRKLLIAGVVILVLVAFGGGYLFSRNASTPAASGEPSTTSATESTTISPTTSVTGTITPSPEDPTHLVDGRYFVYAKKVRTSGGEMRLTFDLAYLLNGDAANEAAAARGYETPVPNDYFIVNDNPLLRTYPIDPGATVRYIPTDAEDQSILVPGSLDQWVAAVNGSEMTDVPIQYSGWWIVIDGGAITSIRQQFLP